MRVSDSNRVLFVHVPKTGGSTIDLMFDHEVPDSRRVPERQRHAPLNRLIDAEPDLATYWTFGFVRNPWARMVSWWTMIHQVFELVEAGDPAAIRKVEKHPTAWLPEGEFRNDFDGFVLEGTAAIAKVGRPQRRTLTAPGREPDFVGRVENFTDDYNVVRERLGLPPVEKAPRKNVTRHRHYSEYYNDTTRAHVAAIFAPDIEAFGYEF
ncbi:MAG TPA: sulfotransferase family 2 domain-containing protein [Marmoricola sp.]